MFWLKHSNFSIQTVSGVRSARLCPPWRCMNRISISRIGHYCWRLWCGENNASDILALISSIGTSGAATDFWVGGTEVRASMADKAPEHWKKCDCFLASAVWLVITSGARSAERNSFLNNGQTWAWATGLSAGQSRFWKAYISKSILPKSTWFSLAGRPIQ